MSYRKLSAQFFHNETETVLSMKRKIPIEQYLPAREFLHAFHCCLVQKVFAYRLVEYASFSLGDHLSFSVVFDEFKIRIFSDLLHFNYLAHTPKIESRKKCLKTFICYL